MPKHLLSPMYKESEREKGSVKRLQASLCFSFLLLAFLLLMKAEDERKVKGCCICGTRFLGISGTCWCTWKKALPRRHLSVGPVV